MKLNWERMTDRLLIIVKGSVAHNSLKIIIYYNAPHACMHCVSSGVYMYVTLSFVIQRIENYTITICYFFSQTKYIIKVIFVIPV